MRDNKKSVLFLIRLPAEVREAVHAEMVRRLVCGERRVSASQVIRDAIYRAEWAPKPAHGEGGD